MHFIKRLSLIYFDNKLYTTNFLLSYTIQTFYFVQDNYLRHGTYSYKKTSRWISVSLQA